MGEGLIQLLVIGFFVVISMMDGVARKKRQAQQREAGARIDPHDESSDYGDLFSTTSETSLETTPEVTPEGVVPAELWEEIAGLARGGPSPSARQLPPTSAPEEGLEEESWLDPAHQHVESHDHVEWEPSDRSTYQPVPSYDDKTSSTSINIPASRSPVETSTRAVTECVATFPVLLPSDEPVAAIRSTNRGTSVRRSLLYGGQASIRRAMILSEVLGPPAALRDLDHEPPGSGR